MGTTVHEGTADQNLNRWTKSAVEACFTEDTQDRNSGIPFEEAGLTAVVPLDKGSADGRVQVPRNEGNAFYRCRFKRSVSPKEPSLTSEGAISARTS